MAQKKVGDDLSLSLAERAALAMRSWDNTRKPMTRERYLRKAKKNQAKKFRAKLAERAAKSAATEDKP